MTSWLYFIRIWSLAVEHSRSYRMFLFNMRSSRVSIIIRNGPLDIPPLFLAFNSFPVCMIFARVCCALIAIFEFTTLTSEHTCSTRIERVQHTIHNSAQQASDESASTSTQGTRSSMTMKIKRFRIAFRCATYTWPLSDENIYKEMRETNVLF